MSRSPSPWGQRSLSPVVSPASSSSTQISLAETDDASPASSQSSLVHSTVPPCKPQLPPSPRTAQPITPSILLNPIPSTSSSSPPSSSTSSSILKRLPGKRRQSSVVAVVEVTHSPPPAHFFHDPDSTEEDRERLGRSPTSIHARMSPPRAERPDLAGMRSRSASPITHTPRSSSPRRPVAAPSSTLSPPSLEPVSSSAPDPSFVPLSSIISNSSSTSTGGGQSQSIRFAPLPPGKSYGRRSNSISLGVASRARMINAQGGTPNVQQARYAGPLQWYEGGELPEDVYTWRDAQRGISKIWKKVNGAGGAKGKEKEKERSNSLSSTTSGGSVDEAKRMEREAKSGGNKGEVEHVEEAPATIQEEEDDDDDQEGESTPDTPPESALGLTNLGDRVGVDDVELERERRRREKGKAKQVDVARAPAPAIH